MSAENDTGFGSDTARTARAVRSMLAGLEDAVEERRLRDEFAMAVLPALFTYHATDPATGRPMDTVNTRRVASTLWTVVDRLMEERAVRYAPSKQDEVAEAVRDGNE